MDARAWAISSPGLGDTPLGAACSKTVGGQRNSRKSLVDTQNGPVWAPGWFLCPCPLQGLSNAPTSQAAGQEAIGWHQWCRCVSSEVSPAGVGRVQEQWEGHSVSELAGDVWEKASATERVGPHHMGEGEKGPCSTFWLEERVTCICGACAWCLLTGGGVREILCSL